MTIGWDDNRPIYRQIESMVAGMILDGTLPPGAALPSVRQIAADYQVNPLTVSRAYQSLVDTAIIEKRRGLGMYVTDDGRERLLAAERERFIREEWPAVLVRTRQLGLDVHELANAADSEDAG
ncbi:MAG: GntR family transcriptional regulator [Proteobacteria bacterium]|nr:GntR family transcriptional regulator [Pseudomonadota bacterium]